MPNYSPFFSQKSASSKGPASKNPKIKPITTLEELCALSESEFVSYMVNTSTEEELRYLLTLLTKKPLLSFLPKLSMRSNKIIYSNENTMDTLATKIYYKVKDPKFLSDKNMISIALSKAAYYIFGLIGAYIMAIGIGRSYNKELGESIAFAPALSVMMLDEMLTDKVGAEEKKGVYATGVGGGILLLSSFFYKFMQFRKHGRRNLKSNNRRIVNTFLTRKKNVKKANNTEKMSS